MWSDSHAHLSELSISEFQETLERSQAAEVNQVLNIGTNISTSRVAIERNEMKWPIELYSAAGISAADIKEYDLNDSQWQDDLYKLSESSHCVAIGEIGIDGINEYYGPFERQLAFFRKQLAIAVDVNLPVIIHSRGVEAMALEEVVKAGVKKAVFHCYTGDAETASNVAKAGYYVSFSGIVTFKRSDYDEVIQSVPLEKLLIETDSPYLSPEPYRGKTNEPQRVKEIGKYIANHLSMPDSSVAAATTDNFSSLFL